jgi:putative hydrolase of the HAD superfamily
VGTEIRGLIFDLDGTLVDHRSSVAGALRGWLPQFGLVFDEALLVEWLTAEQRHFPAWRSRRITFAEQRRRRLRDFLPLIGQSVGDDEQLDAVFAGYLAWYEASWMAFEDVEDAVRLVTRSGFRVAVLTNGTVEQQNAKMDRTGLAGKFGPVLTAEGIGAAKPDPRAYTTACLRLGLPAAQVLHVGDLHDLDVLAARAAGLRAVLLDRGDEGPHDETERITSLDQLADHVADLNREA